MIQSMNEISSAIMHESTASLFDAFMMAEAKSPELQPGLYSDGHHLKPEIYDYIGLMLIRQLQLELAMPKQEAGSRFDYIERSSE